MSQMDVNLQRTYNNMRRFVKSAVNPDHAVPYATQVPQSGGRNKQDSLDPSLLPYNHLQNPSQTSEGHAFNHLKPNQIGMQ